MIGKIITVVAILAGIGIIFYAAENPDEISAIFVDRPDVRFFDQPTLSEQKIPVNFSSQLSFTARNYDEQDVSNVEARLVITEGENWENHLQFEKITPLTDSLSPGETTKNINIPIKATNLSGIETPFTLQLELYADGKLTAKKTFDIKIIDS